MYHTNTKVTNYGRENKDYCVCRYISQKAMYVKVFKRNAVKDHSKEVSPVYQRGSLLLWVDECGLAALLLVCLLHLNLQSF